MIKIFSYYKNRLLYEGIRALISNLEDIYILGGSHLSEIGLSNPLIEDCNIVLIEFDLADYEFIHTLQLFKERCPDTSILLLGANCHFASNMLTDVLNVGITGYILKDCSKLDLINALQKASRHEKHICTRIFDKVFPFHEPMKNGKNLLTQRESEMLSLIVKGGLNKNIADHLKVRESTVKSHKKNIMQKLQSDNLIALISKALELDLISKEDLPFCSYCH